MTGAKGRDEHDGGAMTDSECRPLRQTGWEEGEIRT
jgi:hypothetical protein